MCLPGFCKWVEGENHKWLIRECRVCGRRVEINKYPGDGFQPQPLVVTTTQKEMDKYIHGAIPIEIDLQRIQDDIDNRI